MTRRVLSLVFMASMVQMLPAQAPPTPAQLAEQIVHRYTAVLGLSSTQQESAITIFTAETTAEAAVRTAEQTAEKTLLAAVEADETATISTASATLGGLRGQEIQARAVANASFYALLTTEQQTKFAEYLEHGGLNDHPFGPPRR